MIPTRATVSCRQKDLALKVPLGLSVGIYRMGPKEARDHPKQSFF